MKKNFIEIKKDEFDRLKNIEKNIKDLPEELKPIEWKKEEKENARAFPANNGMVEVHLQEVSRLKAIDVMAKKKKPVADKKEIKKPEEK